MVVRRITDQYVTVAECSGCSCAERGAPIERLTINLEQHKTGQASSTMRETAEAIAVRVWRPIATWPTTGSILPLSMIRTSKELMDAALKCLIGAQELASVLRVCSGRGGSLEGVYL